MRKLFKTLAIFAVSFLFIGATLKEDGKLKIKGTVTDAAFAPDGKYLAIASQMGVGIWEISSRKEVKRIDDINAMSVAFAPEGNLFAYGSMEGKIHVCSFPELKCETEFDAGKKPIRQLAFTSDGKYILTNRLVFYNLKGKQHAQLESESPANAVAISPDGKTILSAHRDGKVLAWNAKRKKLISKTIAHKGEVNAVIFMPEGVKFISAGSDGSAKIWNLQGLGKLKEMKHTSSVLSLSLSPNGRLVACGTQDGRVSLWDTRTGELIGSFAHRLNMPVEVVKFSPHQNLLVSCGWGMIKIWTVK